MPISKYVSSKKKIKLTWTTTGDVHLLKKQEIIKNEEGRAITYWKIVSESGVFLCFKESVNNQIDECIDSGVGITPRGEIKIVSGGTYLVITHIKKGGKTWTG